MLSMNRPCVIIVLTRLALHNARSTHPFSVTVDERPYSCHLGTWDIWQIFHGKVTISIRFVSFRRRMPLGFGSPQARGKESLQNATVLRVPMGLVTRRWLCLVVIPARYEKGTESRDRSQDDANLCCQYDEISLPYLVNRSIKLDARDSCNRDQNHDHGQAQGESQDCFLCPPYLDLPYQSNRNIQDSDARQSLLLSSMFDWTHSTNRQ